MIWEEFASFRQSWLVAISSTLNQSLLPSSLYSMIERRTLRLRKHWPSLEEQNDSSINLGPSEASVWGDGEHKIFNVTSAPPKVGFVSQADHFLDALEHDRIGIYRCEDDLLLSYIEILAPSDINQYGNFLRLIDSFVEMLREDCQLLVIDLIQRDPYLHDSGTHAALWHRFTGRTSCVTNHEPYGIAAYGVFSEVRATAYFERLAVRQNLPVMPLFLTSDEYINLPLQDTYDDAWRGVPVRWKSVLEAPKTP